MGFDNEIICTDRNGIQNQFKYSIEESEENGKVKWIFRVMPFDLISTDWFEFAITVINPTIGKVTVMDNRNMVQYRGKGITEKMIEEAANVLELTIISSTNNPQNKSLSTEWRTPAADIIWERLKGKGLATYNTEADIYTFIKRQ
ncbi:MAG: hypothetical protein IPI46_01560 [Bacteroidetes bacterium]|nr:hypothetical protein [Bacteroidota bacterium]